VNIFLSYRRGDATSAAMLLRYKLQERFPEAAVFMDASSIPLGVDYIERIEQAVRISDVLLAVIGPKWLTIADERRLDDREDLLSREINLALDQGVRVIPVLVDGAISPDEMHLPPALKRLARRQALELSSSRYDYDVGRLFDTISQSVSSPQPASPATETPAAVKKERSSRRTPRYLVVTRIPKWSRSTGTSIELSGQRVTIGRASDVTLVLNDDDYISPRHAQIYPRDGEWIIEDLGSTNGTYLDREKVTRPTPVPIGVPIRIGRHVLELRT